MSHVQHQTKKIQAFNVMLLHIMTAIHLIFGRFKQFICFSKSKSAHRSLKAIDFNTQH
jgi:hypothetical protein